MKMETWLFVNIIDSLITILFQQSRWQVQSSRSKLNNKIKLHNILCLQLNFLQFGRSWAPILTLTWVYLSIKAQLHMFIDSPRNWPNRWYDECVTWSSIKTNRIENDLNLQPLHLFSMVQYIHTKFQIPTVDSACQ